MVNMVIMGIEAPVIMQSLVADVMSSEQKREVLLVFGFWVGVHIEVLSPELID